MSNTVNTKAGAAHFWFFDEFYGTDDQPIVDWQASIQDTQNTTAEYSKDCLPMIYESSNGNNKRVIKRNNNDFHWISPEKQLNNAQVSLERDTLGLQTQLSSRPVGYSRTGLMANIRISIADITLKNLALAFGEKLTESGDSDKLSLSDQASKKIPAFGLVVIPHPFMFVGDSSLSNDLANSDPVFPANTSDADKAIEWRNSWIYLPSAKIVEATPNLVYGVDQQQEITVQVMGCPDLRADRSLADSNPLVNQGEIDYAKEEDAFYDYDRVILGYPKYKQFGTAHDPEA